MDLSGARWRKSSFSGNNGDSTGCVEVAALAGGDVAIRDTKDRALAPHVYPGREWAAFLLAVRSGEFDRG